MALTKVTTLARPVNRERDISLEVSRSETPYQTMKLKKVVKEALKGAQRKRAIKRALKSIA
jgi:hypothetical protein